MSQGVASVQRAAARPRRAAAGGAGAVAAGAAAVTGGVDRMGSGGRSGGDAARVGDDHTGGVARAAAAETWVSAWKRRGWQEAPKCAIWRRTEPKDAAPGSHAGLGNPFVYRPI
jgi:hypothetical protein